MKTKIDCGCEKDVFVCRTHCKAQDSAQHTPIPWEAQFLEADGVIIKRDGWEITTPDYDVCANLHNGAPIRKAEDAAFIVRAVNAHEELLELAKHVRLNLPSSPSAEQLDVIVRWADRAIAKAEGHL